jgi:hypothetical protein
VLAGAGAGGVFVLVLLVEVSELDGLQAVSTPIVRPNSTIRVYNLFIGRRNLDQKLLKDK